MQRDRWLAIVDGRPKVLTLKEMITHFLDHRRDVVTRRSLFELKEAKSRQEIVEGLVIAVDNIDRVIQIIRAAETPEEAKINLIAEPLAGLEEFLRRAGRSEDEIARRTEKGDYQLTVAAVPLADGRTHVVLQLRAAAPNENPTR